MRKNNPTNGEIVLNLCYKKFFYLISMLISNIDPGTGKLKGFMKRFSDMIKEPRY